MQHLIQTHNLLCRIRLTGLLSIPESRIGNPYIFRHLHRYQTSVKNNLGNFIVFEILTIQIRTLNILQNIIELRLLQKMSIGIHMQIGIFIDTVHSLLLLSYHALAGCELHHTKFPVASQAFF